MLPPSRCLGRLLPVLCLLAAAPSARADDDPRLRTCRLIEDTLAVQYDAVIGEAGPRLERLRQTLRDEHADAFRRFEESLTAADRQAIIAYFHAFEPIRGATYVDGGFVDISRLSESTSPPIVAMINRRLAPIRARMSPVPETDPIRRRGSEPGWIQAEPDFEEPTEDLTAQLIDVQAATYYGIFLRTCSVHREEGGTTLGRACASYELKLEDGRLVSETTPSSQRQVSVLGIGHGDTSRAAFARNHVPYDCEELLYADRSSDPAENPDPEVTRRVLPAVVVDRPSGATPPARESADGLSAPRPGSVPARD